jgi:surface protein
MNRAVLLMGISNKKNSLIYEVDTRIVSSGSTNNNQLSIPLGYESSIPGITNNKNFKVDWGDGNVTTHANKLSSPVHTYTTPGIYIVKLTPPPGTWLAISVEGFVDVRKLLRLLQFGKRSYIDRNTFNMAVNLRLNDVLDSPVWVYTLFQSFHTTSSINNVPNIESWNISSVTSMAGAFRSSLINQNIDSWDTSNVTSMGDAFRSATLFNQDITNWDVSKVTDMALMFNGASSFNQDISKWDFNINVLLSSFLGSATAFSTANYDKLLEKLATVMIGSGRTAAKNLGASGVKYTATGKTYRDLLVVDGWTITDGGLA